MFKPYCSIGLNGGAMLINKIEELREKLNKECESDNLISDKIVGLSQALDEYIVMYYKAKINNKALEKDKLLEK